MILTRSETLEPWSGFIETCQALNILSHHGHTPLRLTKLRLHRFSLRTRTNMDGVKIMLRQQNVSITGPQGDEPEEVGPLSVRLLDTKEATRLAPLLRKEDLRECEDFGYSPTDALWYAAMLNHSEHREACFAVYSDMRGENAPPVFVFGYSERCGGKIWMLGQ